MRRIYLSVILVIAAILTLSTTTPTQAKARTQTATPAPQEVSIKMSDGLEIKGTYYLAPTTSAEVKAPAVLLLHQNNGYRGQWDRLVPVLTSAGYSVLAVDQRGFGKTGGEKDYLLLEKDGVALMNWLRAQPSIDKDRVAVIGASVGSNAALRACAADENCHAVVALSPGIDFYELKPASAIKTMSNKGIMLVAAQLDTESADAVKAFVPDVPEDATVLLKIYGKVRLHGTDLLFTPDLSGLIIGWLDSYNKKI